MWCPAAPSPFTVQGTAAAAAGEEAAAAEAPPFAPRPAPRPPPLIVSPLELEVASSRPAAALGRCAARGCAACGQGREDEGGGAEGAAQQRGRLGPW